MLRERVLEAVQPQQQADTAEAASHIPLNEEPKSPKSGMKRRHRKLSTLQQVLQKPQCKWLCRHRISCVQRAGVCEVLTGCANRSAGGSRRRRGGRRASGGHCTRCEGGRSEGRQGPQCGVGCSKGADCTRHGAADHRDAGGSGQLCIQRGALLRCAACSRTAWADQEALRVVHNQAY